MDVLRDARPFHIDAWVLLPENDDGPARGRRGQGAACGLREDSVEGLGVQHPLAPLFQVRTLRVLDLAVGPLGEWAEA